MVETARSGSDIMAAGLAAVMQVGRGEAANDTLWIQTWAATTRSPRGSCPLWLARTSR